MKKFFSLFISVVIVICSSFNVFAYEYSKDYPQRFWDVPKDHWAFNYIAELVNKGVLAGYEDGSFKPDSTVTRAEWAKIMVLAAGLPANDNNVYFTDMGNHWANAYVNTAKDYLAAYTDGTFKPDQAAVREDVTVGMVKLKGYDVSNVDYSYLSQFTDVNSISNSLKAYVAVAVEKDLISGFDDGTFRGQNTLTRAEAATLLWRAFQYGNDNKVVDTPDTPVTTPPATTVTTPPTTTTPPAQTEEQQQTPDNTTPDNTVETPEPTDIPKPTTEPEDGEEREPESQKSYKVETVVKAKVDSPLLYTKDDNDNLYYVENNQIHSVNLITGETNDFCGSEDLDSFTDEADFIDFEFSSIAYDNVNNIIYFTGHYSNMNPANFCQNEFLMKCDSKKVWSITDKFSYNLVDVLSNGDFVTSDGTIIDKETFEYKTHCLGSYNLNGREAAFVGDIVESDGKLYGIACLGYDMDCAWGMMAFGLSEYTFTDKTSMVLDFPRIYSGAISEDCIVVNLGNKLSCMNYYGKELYAIYEDDIEVKDYSILKLSDIGAINDTNVSDDSVIMGKMLLTSDGNIVLYDTMNRSFRIISENDGEEN